MRARSTQSLICTFGPTVRIGGCGVLIRKMESVGPGTRAEMVEHSGAARHGAGEWEAAVNRSGSSLVQSQNAAGKLKHFRILVCVGRSRQPNAPWLQLPCPSSPVHPQDVYGEYCIAELQGAAPPPPPDHSLRQFLRVLIGPNTSISRTRCSMTTSCLKPNPHVGDAGVRSLLVEHGLLHPLLNIPQHSLICRIPCTEDSGEILKTPTILQPSAAMEIVGVYSVLCRLIHVASACFNSISSLRVHPVRTEPLQRIGLTA